MDESNVFIDVRILEYVIVTATKEGTSSHRTDRRISALKCSVELMSVARRGATMLMRRRNEAITTNTAIPYSRIDLALDDFTQSAICSRNKHPKIAQATADSEENPMYDQYSY